MSIDPSQILHIKGAVKTDLNLTTGAGSKIGVGVDAPDGVVHILHDQPTIVVAESGTNTSVGRLHANNHSLEIQAGLTSSADSKANIVFSSYGGATKYIEIDGAGGGPRGNVHVNSDMHAANVYANTLFLENLAIGEVVQGLNEVLNTNNEASNNLIISNLEPATSVTTGALRVAGGIATQGNVYANAVYTANLFSSTGELNLSSDVVKLGNKIELGYGNADNNDHNIGLVMTARQKFWSNVATADLPNPTTNAHEYMGYGVGIDRAGDRIVSGAHGSAYAYVFHRDANTKTWPSTPTATFTNPSGGATGFGVCPTISKDGTRIFIDETGNDEGGTDIGRLYVYTYENGLWNTTPVDLPGQSASEQMGWSVDCSADGSAVIVGARYNTEGATSIGRAYIFTETSGTWSTTPFDLPGEQSHAEFGIAVAMNDAGDRVAVGSYGYDDGAALSVGKVYVYHRGGGGTWSATPTATFVGPTQTPPRNNYGIGFSLDMNASGTRFVTGAAVDYAAVYEYDASTSAWKTTPIAEFKGEDYGTLGDLFGYNVSMNDAGDRISVGSFTGATSDIFEEVNGAWVHAKRLHNQTSNEYFGSGLNASALNGVGDTLVLGAHGNDEAATDNGRVYVFDQVEPSNVAIAYDGHETVKIGFTSNVVTDTVVDTNTSNLNVEIAGDLTLTGSGNVAAGKISGTRLDIVDGPLRLTGGSATANVTCLETATNRLQSLEIEYPGTQTWVTQPMFGGAVTMSGDGTTMVVGSYENANYGNGGAYVYEGSGTSWTLRGQLRVSGFGGPNSLWVSISEDGSVIVCTGQETPTLTTSPKTFIYVRSGSNWTGNVSNPTATLTGSHYTGSKNWVASSDISKDGNTIVVGNSWDDYSSQYERGSVAVYVKPSGGWATTSTATRVLYTSDGAANDQLGSRARISGDGSTIVASASGTDNWQGLSDTGAVYVYVKGSAWSSASQTQAAKLTRSDDAASNFFGNSGLSISDDGATIVAGFSGHTTNQGAAYVFMKASGGWSTMTSESCKITASDGAPNNYFGTKGSISGDASKITIGAHYTEGQRGACYIYDRPSGGWNASSTLSTHTHKLVGSLVGDYVGAGMSTNSEMDNNNSVVVTGAYGRNNYKGAVIVWDLNNYVKNTMLRATGVDGIYAPGSVFQVVQYVKTDTATTNSTGFVDTGLVVSLTPRTTTSKILVSYAANIGTNSNHAFLRLVRNGTPIAIGDAAGSRVQCTHYVRHHNDDTLESYCMEFLDSPSTTSEVTYKLQYSVPSTSYTVTLNGDAHWSDNNNYGRGPSTITAKEIAQ